MKVAGVWHFGLTVTNIEETVRFFCDYLGLRLVFPVTERSGPGVESVVGIPGARFLVCFIETPDNMNIELHQYLAPKGRKINLRKCNPGVAHLAFRVPDIDRIYDDLVAKGIEFTSPPISMEGGPLKGGKACYLKGPDGISLELVQMPVRA